MALKRVRFQFPEVGSALKLTEKMITPYRPMGRRVMAFDLR